MIDDHQTNLSFMYINRIAKTKKLMATNLTLLGYYLLQIPPDMDLIYLIIIIAG